MITTQVRQEEKVFSYRDVFEEGNELRGAGGGGASLLMLVPCLGLRVCVDTGGRA